MRIKNKNKFYLQKILGIAFIMVFCMITSIQLQATTVDTIQMPGITVDMNSEATASEVSGTFQMVLVLTIIALAPSILILMTAFLRIVITLHFVRSAVGTSTMPPNQVLVGIALFLTFFVMSPVISKINTTAIAPFEKGQITQEQAIENGIVPLKEFMLRQTRDEDISLFMDIAEEPLLTDDSNIAEDIPLHVLVPAFIISELRAGFIIGFAIYIPFIVIDMIVASTLMSMGMMMLPPAMISLPFKVLLFVLVDGWNLIISQLLQTFN